MFNGMAMGSGVQKQTHFPPYRTTRPSAPSLQSHAIRIRVINQIHPHTHYVPLSLQGVSEDSQETSSKSASAIRLANGESGRSCMAGRRGGRCIVGAASRRSSWAGGRGSSGGGRANSLNNRLVTALDRAAVLDAVQVVGVGKDTLLDPLLALHGGQTLLVVGNVGLDGLILADTGGIERSRDAVVGLCATAELTASVLLSKTPVRPY